MEKTKINIFSKKMLADTHTPVSLYLKVRDHFENPILLESNDYRSRENCFSFIGLQPIASISIKDFKADLIRPDHRKSVQLDSVKASRDLIQTFFDGYEIEEQEGQLPNGFFGFTNFDAVKYFDTISFEGVTDDAISIPDFHYSMYKYMIAINHFKEEMHLIQNAFPGEENTLEELESKIQRQAANHFPFQLEGGETSDLTDQEYIDLVLKGKHHCKRGDVFQIVLARRFRQAFKGDEFNVYRVLRSVNPSPYLFYFDFGGFKIFGSSPESQIVVKDGVASINPIAGTYKRTGNDKEDAALAQELLNDPKEIAEHTMLVDLARNDLGRQSKNVTVRDYKDVQYFSHVIHLVSLVDGELNEGTNSTAVLADTFPAGTLSGAPKFRAIELINKYEKHSRSFYGGAIGYIGFNGNINHAITIRSFLSKDNTLYYQAGAGIVQASNEQSEMQEVNNKLAALTKALKEAEKLK
jgi:anthranilate synthase component 1